MKRRILAILCGLISMFGVSYLLFRFPFSSIIDMVMTMVFKVSDFQFTTRYIAQCMFITIALSTIITLDLSSLIGGIVIGWIGRTKGKVSAGVTVLLLGIIFLVSFILVGLEEPFRLPPGSQAGIELNTISIGLLIALTIFTMVLFAMLGGLLGEHLTRRGRLKAKTT